MSTPDLNAGDLPHLTTVRPGHRSDSHSTTRDLFGHDGQFFTVPGTFPDGLPDHTGFTTVVCAVLRTPDLTTGADAFTVREVDRHRRPLGAPDADQDTAIRSALTAVAERRRAHARYVQHNRVHVLGLEPVSPVRVGHSTTGACVLHVRCSCPHVEGRAAHFEHVSQAAADWLDETPTTPWELCSTSPTRITTPNGSGRLTGTLRDSKGTAVVEIQHTDRDAEVIALAQVVELA